MKEKTARIKNMAARTALILPFERADTLPARARGLMFRKNPLAILFTFDFAAPHAIHSFFVPFEFDAVYLDEKMRVTEVFERIKPFVPLLAPALPALYLLELPAGAAEKLKLSASHQIQITEA